MAGLSNLDIEITINELAAMLAKEPDEAMIEWLKCLVEETDNQRWLINRTKGVSAEFELRDLKDTPNAIYRAIRKKIAA